MIPKYHCKDCDKVFAFNVDTTDDICPYCHSRVRTFPYDDWRSHTCGECAWAMLNGDCLYCRRVSWNLIPINKDVQYSGHGAVQHNTQACPAFIAASIAAGKE